MFMHDSLALQDARVKRLARRMPPGVRALAA